MQLMVPFRRWAVDGMPEAPMGFALAVSLPLKTRLGLVGTIAAQKQYNLKV